MTPALAFLVVAAVLIKAGWRNQNVIDTLLGRDTENPHGRVPGDSGETSGGAPASGATPLFGTGGGPLARLGKIIGTPHAGTHTLGNWQSDNAVDISVPTGTQMLAMEDGVIEKVRHHPQDGGRFAGDQITLKGSSNSYFYAHGVSRVRAGQHVTAGQVLGTTGSANGVAHLHFGILSGNPLDTLKHWLGR